MNLNSLVVSNTSGSTASTAAPKRIFKPSSQLLIILVLGSLSTATAQLTDPSQSATLYGAPDLTVSVAAQPNVLYAGITNSGVYETSQITVRVDNKLTARPSRTGGYALYGSQANGVTVRINIGKGLQVAGTNYRADNNFQCSVLSQTITCSNGVLARGASAEIRFDVIAPVPVACYFNTIVEATVDPDSTIPETSEINNTNATTITLQTIC